jgi:hypothetical protein
VSPKINSGDRITIWKTENKKYKCCAEEKTFNMASIQPGWWLTPVILATWEAEIGRIET